jgi:hypothetical protein
MRHRGHPAARFGALAAHLSASLHRGIVSELLAVLGAALADLCTDLTGAPVQVGAAEHEVGARLADLRTVEEQPNVGSLDVPPTMPKTV